MRPHRANVRAPPSRPLATRSPLRLAWNSHAPDVEEHDAVVDELLRVCPPPANSVVHDPEGEVFDLL